MNPLAKIFVYLGAVVFLAAVVSPPVYMLAQWGAEHGVIPALAEFPFFRFYSRIAQIAAMVLLIPAALWIRVRSLSELGLERNPRRWKDLGFGLALAFIPVALLAAGYFFFEIYRPRDDVNSFKLIRIFFTASFVSVFEELFFRGLLLGLAVRVLGRVGGLSAVTIFFAVVHFIKPRAEFAPDEVGWMSGFALLGSAFSHELGAEVLIWGMVTLLLIGWILGYACLKTRSLWLPIGLHAGWIFVQQTLHLYGRFRVRPPDEWLPWVGPNVVSGMVPTGIVPIVVLLVTGAILWWSLRREHTEPT